MNGTQPIPRISQGKTGVSGDKFATRTGKKNRPDPIIEVNPNKTPFSVDNGTISLLFITCDSYWDEHFA